MAGMQPDGQVVAPKTLGQWRKRCIMAHLAPRPPLHIARELSAAKMVNSMMDVSDGLSIDLQRLCEASGVGAVVYSSKLPVCPMAILDQERQRECNLHGGEDYAMLFTVPMEMIGQLDGIMRKYSDIPIAMIGQITKEKGIFIEAGASRNALRPMGFDHFSRRT
jgi:thiamine-monophosphate kinase